MNTIVAPITVIILVNATSLAFLKAQFDNVIFLCSAAGGRVAGRRGNGLAGGCRVHQHGPHSACSRQAQAHLDCRAVQDQ